MPRANMKFHENGIKNEAHFGAKILKSMRTRVGMGSSENFWEMQMMTVYTSVLRSWLLAVHTSC